MRALRRGIRCGSLSVLRATPQWRRNLSTSLALMHVPQKSTQKTLTSEERLSRRINTLVGQRKVCEAVAVLRGGLRGDVPVFRARDAPSEEGGTPVVEHMGRPVLSMEALAAVLHACKNNDQVSLGLTIVDEVRQHGIITEWKEENVLFGILRLQCAAGDEVGATHLFTYLLQSHAVRLRSASAFLRFCCEPPRLNRRMAFAVYEECMKRGIELTVEDYTALGRMCVQLREPIDTLFRILREMREHIPEVDLGMVDQVLRPWCELGGRSLTKVAIPIYAHDGDTNAAAAVEAGCHIQKRSPSGRCLNCEAVLQGYPLTAAYRDRLLKDLTEVVVPQKCRNRRAMIGFDTWKRYIAARKSNDPIDILIDGANLGYYGLSSWYDIAKRALLRKRGVAESRITEADLDFSANCKRDPGGVDVGVNFQLIHCAVTDAVERYGFRRPLVTLHERHCEAKNMSSEDEAILEEWRTKGFVYSTPTGLNDDLCWLYAALELTEPTEMSLCATSLCAIRTEPRLVYVLTNDLMRDHHFKLLRPRYFARWRDRHRIGFTCVRRDGRTEMRWQMPSPFTRCIQESSADCWHIPYLSTDDVQGALISGANSDEGAVPARFEENFSSEPSGWVCIR